MSVRIIWLIRFKINSMPHKNKFDKPTYESILSLINSIHPKRPFFFIRIQIRIKRQAWRTLKEDGRPKKEVEETRQRGIMSTIKRQQIYIWNFNSSIKIETAFLSEKHLKGRNEVFIYEEAPTEIPKVILWISNWLKGYWRIGDKKA